MSLQRQLPTPGSARRFDVAATIGTLGGAATRQQLLARDLSGYDLTRAVRRGEVLRIRQGRYILKTTAQDVSTAVRVGGMLAGPSAARSYGIWSGTDQRLHLSVGDHATRLRTNSRPSFAPPGTLTSDRGTRPIVLHWLVDGAVDETGAECWRVTLGACLRQMVEWTTEETALACLDTTVQSGLITRDALRLLFVGEPLRSRLIVARVRYGSDSGTESIVSRRLRAIGIQVDQQVTIRGVGRVDMRVRGSRVIVEVDGRTYHEDPVAFENDRRRDAELIARGFVVVRLSYLRVLGDWAWCQKMVLAAIANH